MKAAIVDGSGDLLYWGNINSARFATVLALPGSVQVNSAPDGNDHWDGSAWTTNPVSDTRPPKGQANGNNVPELRADVDAIWQALEDAGIVQP